MVRPRYDSECNSSYYSLISGGLVHAVLYILRRQLLMCSLNTQDTCAVALTKPKQLSGSNGKNRVRRSSSEASVNCCWQLQDITERASNTIIELTVSARCFYQLDPPFCLWTVRPALFPANARMLAHTLVSWLLWTIMQEPQPSVSCAYCDQSSLGGMLRYACSYGRA